MWLLLASAIGLVPPASAQQPIATREYKVKIAYIYNFTRYIQWPDHAFTNANSPFVIAVFGNDPFGPSLDVLQQRKKASGRPISVQRYSALENVQQAHVMFVSIGTPDADVAELLHGAMGGEPQLIVCETPGHGVAGAPINFFHDQDGTIGFELNVDAISRRGLTVDAKLLSVARVIRDGGLSP